MIANSRQMAVHDFLLVLLSAAVLTLLLWPPSPAIRQVNIRRNDGSVQSYQLATNDPKLAKLELDLQRWSKPKPNSRLAINKWKAELGGLYAERTLPRVEQQEEKRILPVSYYPDQAEKRATAAREAAKLEQQHGKPRAPWREKNSGRSKCFHCVHVPPSWSVNYGRLPTREMPCLAHP